jgi:Integrase zinc binding domain/Chromo (CHRromatin Organisation MOdifier) domain
LGASLLRAPADGSPLVVAPILFSIDDVFDETLELEVDPLGIGLVPQGEGDPHRLVKERSTLFSNAEPTFTAALRRALKADPFFGPVIKTPALYPLFVVTAEGDVFRSLDDAWHYCVPVGVFKFADGRRASFREVVIEQCHSTLGHLGDIKTRSYARRFFWWPSLVADIAAFCRSCDQCARIKGRTGVPAGPRHMMPVSTRPFGMIYMDFMVGLPLSRFQGEPVDALATVTCGHSSTVVLIPCATWDTALDFARRLKHHVVVRYGLPDRQVSDRDPKFMGAVWQALCRLCGIRHIASTAYHPQLDGRSEVSNRISAQILRHFVDFEQERWAECIDDVEFAINSAPTGKTGLSPFEAVLGYLPRYFPSSMLPVDVPAAGTFVETARQNWLTATDAVIAARHKATVTANKTRRPDPPELSEPGAKAYLATANLHMPEYLTRKFLPRFIGPFAVLEAKPESSTYKLDLPPHLSRVHPVFNVDKLRPHYVNDDARFPGRMPPAQGADGVDDDHVTTSRAPERILLHRQMARSGKLTFFVRWRGYDATEDTWVDEAKVQRLAPALLRDYMVSARLVSRSKGSKTATSRRAATSGPRR